MSLSCSTLQNGGLGRRFLDSPKDFMRTTHRIIVSLACAGLFGIVGPAFALDNAPGLAREDYQSAQAKIQRDHDADMALCGKRSGPAARACTLQADGRRERERSDARETVENAGIPEPLPHEDMKAASKLALNQAKLRNRALKDQIAEEGRLARVECASLSGPARKACHDEVKSRTGDAMARAKSSNQKAVAKATAMRPN
ncbi:MAG: hypothetical protein ABWY05_17460 [Noviherbaspirillum sp.]